MSNMTKQITPVHKGTDKAKEFSGVLQPTADFQELSVGLGS